jgi:hypothetical protein
MDVSGLLVQYATVLEKRCAKLDDIAILVTQLRTSRNKDTMYGKEFMILYDEVLYHCNTFSLFLCGYDPRCL